MLSNEELIRKFYEAFQKRDHTTMCSYYSDDIIFFDPVFGLLKGDEVKAMWQMLCENAKDFSLTFSDIVHLDEEYSTCKWVATYTFSKTGRTVVNRIKANMLFKDGKIIEHSDAFSVYQWSKQALGLSGIFFGWNSYFQNKIKNNARKNLFRYMNTK